MNLVIKTNSIKSVRYKENIVKPPKGTQNAV